jgi:hypothetical protein
MPAAVAPEVIANAVISKAIGKKILRLATYFTVWFDEISLKRCR